MTEINEIFKEIIRSSDHDIQDEAAEFIESKKIKFIEGVNEKAFFIVQNEKNYRLSINLRDKISQCGCFNENSCVHKCAAALYMISNPSEVSMLKASASNKGDEPFLADLAVQLSEDFESFTFLSVYRNNYKFIKKESDIYKLKENNYGIFDFLPGTFREKGFSYNIKVLYKILTEASFAGEIRFFSNDGLPLEYGGCIQAELALAQKSESQFYIQAEFENPENAKKKVSLLNLKNKDDFPLLYSFELEKKTRPENNLISYYSGLYGSSQKEKEPVIQKHLRKKYKFYFISPHEKYNRLILDRYDFLSHIDLVQNKEIFIENEIKNCELVPEKWDTSAELVLLISPQITAGELELKCELYIAYGAHENIVRKLNFSERNNTPVVFFDPRPVSVKHEGYAAARTKDKNICVYRNHRKETRLFEPRLPIVYGKNGDFWVNELKIKNFILEKLPELKKRNVNIGVHKDITTLFEKKQTASFQIGSSSGMPWFQGHIEIMGLSRDDKKALFSAAKKRKDYYRLRNGSWLSLEDIGLTEILRRAEKLGLKINQNFEVEKISTGQLIALDDFLEMRADKKAKEIIKKIKNISEISGAKHEDAGPDFQGELRSYQKTGVAFFRKLYERHLGGIMADDMGLGKTIQTLSFLNKLYFDYPRLKPCLLVSPLSALSVWENEAKKFFPRLSIYRWHGSQKNSEEAKKSHIILTTYPTLSQNHTFFKEETFALMCLDEAQTIKNYASKAATSIRKMNIERIFCLTGTPLENSLSDLWSLFDLSVPGLLGTRKSFLESYDNQALSKDEASSLRRLIKPFLLRRHKDDVVKDLPSKTETDVAVMMTARQKALHEKIRRDALKALENADKNAVFAVLPFLTSLRRIACHPDLKQEQGWDMTNSGKLEYLRDALPELYQSASGVLIFSQFTDVLNLVGKLLEEFNYDYFYLDGSVSHNNRKEQVKLFQEGKKKFFLISLKAGASALTLHQADTIIHLDPWWNPQLENQATDRAYRIGQKRKVFVYRLFSKDSIEEKVLELKAKKQRLFDAVFAGKSFKKNAVISKEEIIDLLSGG
ncbi:MAG: SNF2 family helicase [Spirochaetia bacterium]|nr:SNF2 family helicase [Spirochaetia bacterium]